MDKPRISRTCIMKPKHFLRSVILIVALSAFGISSDVASDKNEAKHSSKITKARGRADRVSQGARRQHPERGAGDSMRTALLVRLYREARIEKRQRDSLAAKVLIDG